MSRAFPASSRRRPARPPTSSGASRRRCTAPTTPSSFSSPSCEGETAVDLAGIGLAAPLTAPQDVGPLVRRVIQRREVVSLRDYSLDTYGESGGRVRIPTRGRHPRRDGRAGDARVATSSGRVGIATTDPDRTFDAIDRQGLFAFAQLAAAAMRSARVRAEREQRIRRLSVLNVLAWELAVVREPYGIARLAYEAAGALVARDSFYVARYDAEKKEFDFILQAEGNESWVGERVSARDRSDEPGRHHRRDLPVHGSGRSGAASRHDVRRERTALRLRGARPAEEPRAPGRRALEPGVSTRARSTTRTSRCCSRSRTSSPPRSRTRSTSRRCASSTSRR